MITPPSKFQGLTSVSNFKRPFKIVLLSGTKKSIKGDSGRRLTARLRVTRRLPSGTHGRGRHCMIEGGGLARWRQWSAKLRNSLRYKSPVRGALVDFTRRSRSDHPYNNKQSYPLLWWCIYCPTNFARLGKKPVALLYKIQINSILQITLI